MQRTGYVPGCCSSIQRARPIEQMLPAASHSAMPVRCLRPSRSISHEPITCGSPTFTGARRSAARLASTIESAGLISKVYFPRILLPTATVLSYIVDFLVGFMVLIPLSTA